PYDLETKTYNSWATENGTAVSKEVQLNSGNKTQISKEVAIRNDSDPHFRMIHVFVDAPPSAEHIDFLNRAGVIGNILHP
ncbi:MAG: hypothetical protein ACRECY_06030, partial [Phyllobacterium sp.]